MIRYELNQSRLKGGRRVKEADVARTLKAVSEALRLRRDTEISVAFVSEKQMRAFNKEWRGKDTVTDVLSFGRLERAEKAERGEMAEILICYEQAKRQAEEMSHSVRDEILFLLVHGILHLSGYDHERPADAKRMFPLQTRILTRLGVDPRI
ncbi:rRNA maturation RNase YbeY [Candidatus Uhrbacteria bacterium RIFCSPHIGHO2_01_FULL_63_20]|uniref:Endoribonuclease YbeY n=1 Tax=Candidatus Uhrbacteria bacterium RIFCSPHIGHO2_01_FULL_63_20 TaxID=1802385 RepID=A0A1F7TNM4_9BACT|nr:MAG: rRNA maturation RNase YbeY [Candidatus Uhrbacteria bacterium RIFCSPHIGHO2_01_FULL_63_20]